MKNFTGFGILVEEEYSQGFSMGCPKGYVSSCGIGYRH